MPRQTPFPYRFEQDQLWNYRSLKAADVLLKLGYDVRPLKPGYEDLVKSGFKVAEK